MRPWLPLRNRSRRWWDLTGKLVAAAVAEIALALLLDRRPPWWPVSCLAVAVAVAVMAFALYEILRYLP